MITLNERLVSGSPIAGLNVRVWALSDALTAEVDLGRRHGLERSYGALAGAVRVEGVWP